MSATYTDGTGDTLTAEPVSIRLLSIDSWRDECGWTWNNWHSLARVPATWADLPVRKLLWTLREHGYLAASSAGRVAIEDDGYNVVIKARGTGEPLYALEYGALSVQS